MCVNVPAQYPAVTQIDAKTHYIGVENREAETMSAIQKRLEKGVAILQELEQINERDSGRHNPRAKSWMDKVREFFEA